MENRKTILKEAGVLLIAAILVSTTLFVFAPMASADAPSGNGYDANGFNWKARTWNGWEPGYESYTIMTLKWSKDWAWDMTTVTSNPYTLVPNDGSTAVGAYFVANFQYYLTYENELIPWNGQTAPAGAYYKVLETYKIMKVSNDLASWDNFYAKNGDWHAWSFFWGNHVPKYIYIQWHVDVWHENILVYDGDYIIAHPYGLGQPLW